MSQIYLPGSDNGSVATDFHTGNGPDAVPVANIINFVGVGGTFSSTGNTVTFTTADDTVPATATTRNNTPTQLGPGIIVPVNGAISIIVNLVAYDVTTGFAGGGQILATVKGIGGVASLCGSPDVTKNMDVSLTGLIFTVEAVGSGAAVLVTGNSDTIDWKANISVVSVT